MSKQLAENGHHLEGSYVYVPRWKGSVLANGMCIAAVQTIFVKTGQAYIPMPLTGEGWMYRAGDGVRNGGDAPQQQQPPEPHCVSGEGDTWQPCWHMRYNGSHCIVQLRREEAHPISHLCDTHNSQVLITIPGYQGVSSKALCILHNWPDSI